MTRKNILHRDLNVEKVLTCPMKFDFKIIDFLLAIDLKKNEWVLKIYSKLMMKEILNYNCDDPFRIDHWGLLLITFS